MKLNELLKNREFKMNWFRLYIVWMWIVIFINFGQFIMPFVFQHNLYDYKYLFFKTIISAVIVILFYITYRYLVVFKKTGYILNNCLLFFSAFLFSVEFAIDSYYTSFINRYDISIAAGCFLFMIIPCLLFWSIPNLIYFTKRKKIFSQYGTINELSEDLNQECLFCRKCGTKLLRDSLFCNNCGAKVEDTINSYAVCIFDASTHTLHKEIKNVNTKRFPPSKFADNNTYYVIESFRDGKKTRLYYTKNNWNKQIELIISEKES